MTRIRYKENGVYMTSTQEIPVDGNTVRVNLDVENNKWFVQSTQDNAVLKEGEGKSFLDLKKKAKVALVELGASFAGEARKRKSATEGLTEQLSDETVSDFSQVVKALDEVDNAEEAEEVTLEALTTEV